MVTWAVALGLVVTGIAAQGCSAPSIPGHDDLLVGDDANAKKSKGSQGDDAPEGTQQGSIELGQTPIAPRETRARTMRRRNARQMHNATNPDASARPARA